MLNKDVLFFDLDGTLTDPALGITNSFIHALKKMGVEIPSYQKLCSFIGPPLIHSFREGMGLSEEQSQDGVKFYREYFSEKGLYENRVYEGIPELLCALRERGKRLFVATSKPEDFSVKIAEHFGIAKYFEKICGSCMDETRTKKSEVIEYALQSAGAAGKEKVLMIGDRMHDVIGAKENGIESCGVLFGYGSRKELEEAGAGFIVQNVRELGELLLGV